MGVYKMIRMHWLVSLIFIIPLALVSCSSRTANLGETFTLQDDEVVRINETDLTIRSKGVGREWDDQDEYINASLAVKMAGEEKTILLYVDEAWDLGDYALKMVSANPFSKPTSCQLLVTKKE